MDRARRGGQGGGVGSNFGNYGNRPHYRREFHRTGGNSIDGNNNSPMFKSVSTWKSLRSRLEDLTSDKAKCLDDLQKLEEDAMKSQNARHSELLNNERESIREKAKDRETLKIKEEEFKAEQEEKLALVEQLKTDDENQSSRATVMKELGDKEEELRLEKDRILESFMVLETQFTAKEKKLTKEIFEERETLNREKSEQMEKLVTQEKNLDLEILRFCQGVERQLSDLDKKLKFDPVMMRNKVLEREIIQRDQTMHHLHSYIGELEERTRLQIDQIQRMDSEYQFQKVQLLQKLENDKACIIAKAKSDGVAEYLQGQWQEYDPNYNASGLNAQQTPLAAAQASAFPFPYPSQDMFAQSPQSPCFQRLKQPTGAILTDLRDRYEDLKLRATIENNDEKFNWTLAMIRKIVSYYESIGMRVYEESAVNKCTSTLIWCPNDHLYPNKVEASFAMGHGDTEEEATDNAAQLAYFNIQCVIANIVDDNSCTANPNANFNMSKEPSPDISYENAIPISKLTVTHECKDENDLTSNTATTASQTPDIESLISLPSEFVPSPNVQSPTEKEETSD